MLSYIVYTSTSFTQSIQLGSQNVEISRFKECLCYTSHFWTAEGMAEETFLLFHSGKTSQKTHWEMSTDNLINYTFLSNYSEFYRCSKYAISIWKGAEKYFSYLTKILPASSYDFNLLKRRAPFTADNLSTWFSFLSHLLLFNIGSLNLIKQWSCTDQSKEDDIQYIYRKLLLVK